MPGGIYMSLMISTHNQSIHVAKGHVVGTQASPGNIKTNTCYEVINIP